MSEVWINVWYCRNCEATYRRWNTDADDYACVRCNRWPMEAAAIVYHENVEPLRSLLVEVTDE